MRNPHYEPAAHIDEVHFMVYPHDSEGRSTALIEAMENGDADFTTMLSRAEVGRLSGVRKLFRPGLSASLLFLNTETPWLADAAVRRAISMTIDRRALAAHSFSNPTAFAARSLLPPGMSEVRSRVLHDPARARTELAALSPQPKPLRMLVIWAPRPYLPHPTSYAESIRDQLAAVGVQVEIERETTATGYFNRVRRGDYDMCLCGWMADSPDPVDFVEALLASNMIPSLDRPGVVAANLARCADPEMDDRLTRFRADPSDERAAAVLERVDENVPVIPLSYGSTAVVHGWKVADYDPDEGIDPAFRLLDIRNRPSSRAASSRPPE